MVCRDVVNFIRGIYLCVGFVVTPGTFVSIHSRCVGFFLCCPSGVVEITVTSVAVVLFPRAVGLQGIR